MDFIDQISNGYDNFIFSIRGEQIIKQFELITLCHNNKSQSSIIESIVINRVKYEYIDIWNIDYNKKQAVALELGSRLMKRIACHLSNIVSSIVNPLSVPPRGYVSRRVMDGHSPHPAPEKLHSCRQR